MDLGAETLSDTSLLVSHLAFWPLLIWVVLTAPWRYLGEQNRLHVFLGSAVAQFLLWQIRADIVGGVHLHLLGATVMTLMFGWRLATLGGCIALTLSTLAGRADWISFALNAWLTVVVPVAVSYRFARFVEHWLPNHFFVYVYMSAFAGGALSMAGVGLLSTLLLRVTNVLSAGSATGQYFLPFVLFLFPEAFFSGALMTLMIVYRPNWVASFDDRRYLYRK